MVRKSQTLANGRAATRTAARRSESMMSGAMQPAEDMVAHAKEYARKKPEVVALWCLGIGFVLGWKLKPW